MHRKSWRDGGRRVSGFRECKKFLHRFIRLTCPSYYGLNENEIRMSCLCYLGVDWISIAKEDSTRARLISNPKERSSEITTVITLTRHRDRKLGSFFRRRFAHRNSVTSPTTNRAHIAEMDASNSSISPLRTAATLLFLPHLVLTLYLASNPTWGLLDADLIGGVNFGLWMAFAYAHHTSTAKSKWEVPVLFALQAAILWGTCYVDSVLKMELFFGNHTYHEKTQQAGFIFGVPTYAIFAMFPVGWHIGRGPCV